MISFDYSPNVISPSFKGGKNPETDRIIRETMTKLKKNLTELEVTESKIRDLYVPISEKLEAAGSYFSKWLAKIFKYFNL